MKYSLNDIFVVPAPISDIESRSECNTYTKDGMLPLFTAPMTSVVSLDNYLMFEENKINPIIPRNIDYEQRYNLCNTVWCAFSLTEFIELYQTKKIGEKMFVLIDIANGHMKKLHDAIKDAKSLLGNNLVIMAGNVANPETYGLLSDAGADYVRIGIGTGSVCITSSNTSIHYPMASLIEECVNISMKLDNPAFIIADGGIKGYSDIIKCLALGADYVMCGSIFNKMLESAGKTFITDTGYPYKLHRECKIRIDAYGTSVIDQYDESVNNIYKTHQYKFTKEHYGMSTRKAQKEIGGEKLKTSEGIETTQEVEYTMPQWVENFTDYLKSTMSYTSSRDLDDFIGNVETIIVSNNSYNSVNR